MHVQTNESQSRQVLPGDITALVNEIGEAKAVNDATIDTLRDMRAKLGEYLPPSQNLTKIGKNNCSALQLYYPAILLLLLLLPLQLILPEFRAG